MHYPVSFPVAQLQLAALSLQPLPLTVKPILCLHGWLDNAASFIPLAAKLPDLPILALEFPGHGHSSHRGADAYYYFFDWVQDLVALCRQQNWQQLTIVGHSMGGMVATALAAAFPELVER
ncbi:MAG TPA: alpha/beta fold hydrolase, partial [Rheinheimera sp.]|uniref:alpha/beta fold hydrolase n=1 Tax=Rheinheimera sp. TaxID=1869214 RepID=UPI002F92F7CF